MVMKTLKPSPFVTHVLWTTAASMASVAANFFVLRFLAAGLGVEKFGLYSLACRLTVFLQPFTTLALGLSLSRYTALAKEARIKNQYLLGGLLLGLIPNFLVLAAGLGGSNFFTALVFYDSRYKVLFFWTLICVMTFFFYTLIDGFYFGTGQIKRANLWQIYLAVAAPLWIAVTFARQGSVEKIMALIGIFYATSLIPLGLQLFRALGDRSSVREIFDRTRELWRYSLPRFSVRVVLAGLFSIGPFLAPHFGSLQDAGFLAVGLMVFRLAELGSSAFGRVILPKAGELLADGQQNYLQEKVEDILSFVVQIGLFMTLHLMVWSEPIILAWMGRPFIPAITVMQILISAVTPYLLFVMLSPVLDAIEEKAVNFKHLLISFSAALAVSLIAGKMFSKNGLALGTAAGLLILGILTALYFHKRCPFHFQSLHLKPTLLWNLVFFAAAFLLKEGLSSYSKGISLVGAGLLAEGLLLAGYLVVLWSLQPRWAQELRKRFMIVSTQNIKEVSS